MGYTMAEHEQSMTVFYYKSNGEVYSYATGIQDFTSFGAHAEDYKIILDVVVLPKDLFILDNMKMFKVNTEDKSLVYNQEMLARFQGYK